MKQLCFDKKKTNIIICIIMIFTALTRLVGLDCMPEGINIDESYGAYNAWALMTEGMDSRGYTFPVYFIAWGSGMNVLSSYLAIPFFKVMGTCVYAYRLPQALIGMCGVYAFYLLGKEFYDEKKGCLLAFVLAINPWHFRNVRFSLDSNMAPGMFLLALCFLVLGMKKKRGYFIPAAILFGATLYCYALAWLVVPFFLLFVLLLFWKRIPLNVMTVLAVLLLFVIAIPLLLFVGINLGIMEEIRTPFMSIPKLPGFRGSEISFTHILEAIPAIGKIFIDPIDSLSTGLYYYFTIPFFLVGVVNHIVSFMKDYKNGENSVEYVMLVWLCCAFIMCAINENMNVVHANMLHIPVVFYGAYGIWKVAELLKNKKILYICIVAWSVSFCFFVHDYLGIPHTHFVSDTAGEAIERAKEIAGEDGTVNIFKYPTIKYSYVLWHEKPSPSDFSENVEYISEVEEWAEMKSYKNFRYVTSYEEMEEGQAYIIRKDMEDTFYNMGYEIEQVNETYSIVM